MPGCSHVLPRRGFGWRAVGSKTSRKQTGSGLPRATPDTAMPLAWNSRLYG